MKATAETAGPSPAPRSSGLSRFESADPAGVEVPRCVIEHTRFSHRGRPVTVIGYPGDPMLVIAAYATADEVAIGLLPPGSTATQQQRSSCAAAVADRNEEA